LSQLKVEFYYYKLHVVCSPKSVFRKARKRIETLFTEFCEQFMIRRNYAKFPDLYKIRILSKITAVMVIQMINKSLNQNTNNLKSLVV